MLIESTGEERSHHNRYQSSFPYLGLLYLHKFLRNPLVTDFYNYYENPIYKPYYISGIRIKTLKQEVRRSERV